MSLQDCLALPAFAVLMGSPFGCADGTFAATGALPIRVSVQHPPDIVLPSAESVCDTGAGAFIMIVLPLQVQVPAGLHIGHVTCVVPFGEMTAG